MATKNEIHDRAVERWLHAKSMRDQGLTLREIGTHFGVSKSRVRYMIWNGDQILRRRARKEAAGKSFDEIVDSLPSIADADPDPLKNIQAAEFYPSVDAAWQDFCETRKHVYGMTLAGYLNFKSAFYFAFSEGILAYCGRCGLDGDEGESFVSEMNEMLERCNSEINDKVVQHAALDYDRMGDQLRELSREHGHDKVRDAAVKHNTTDVDTLRGLLGEAA